MKTLIKIKALLFFAFMGFSCSGDYLDTAPTNSTSPSVIFETTDNAALAVNGLCKLMTRQYLGTQGFNGEGTIKMFYGNYPGADLSVNLPGWSSIINSEYHENVSSIYLYYPWFYYYKIIGNANTIIHNIDDAEGSEEDRQFIKAQALTFRAYSYMMLVQLYSYRWSDSNNGATDGVVLRLDESTGDIPMSTLLEVYRQIYQDLDDAISLYSASGKKRSENYEPDINVAYATYARAALNRQDYANASTYASRAREGYTLMSVTDYKSGFYSPTSEWIWSSYGSLEETLYYYSYFAYIAYSSNASAVRTYPKCISSELYAKIPDSDIRKEMFLDPAGYDYTILTGQAGDDLDALARSLYPTLEPNAIVYAYMQFKIDAEDNPGVGHLNHFRSSEMYLIEAEARYFQNDEAGARDLLIELTQLSGRDPLYSCNKTGNDLLEEIKLYRRIELWGEGFDWFDLKRWGDTLYRKGVNDGGNFITSLAVTIGPDDKNRWTWQLPLRETDYNQAL